MHYLNYSNATVSVLKKFNEKNIYVNTIIVDNLKCQIKGLEFMIETVENLLIKAFTLCIVQKLVVCIYLKY